MCKYKKYKKYQTLTKLENFQNNLYLCIFDMFMFL